MGKWKNIGYIFVHRLLLHKIKYISKQSSLLSLNFVKVTGFTDVNSYKLESTLSLEEIIQRADNHYEEKRYEEVYELLNHYKYYGHEVVWRLGRILYEMSCNNNLTKASQLALLNEGLNLVNTALRTYYEKSSLYKWKAILLNAKCKHEGIVCEVKMAKDVKECLMCANELDPTDVAVLYMLGQWCFQMANFTWFQRKITALMYCDLPSSTYEEAYDYLIKAEKLQPYPCILNAYLLGRVAYYLKQYFRAHYYLKMASNLPVRLEKEKKIKVIAKRLSDKLGKYDLSKAALTSVDIKL